MSKQPAGKLWIDITDLWYWEGLFTGIQNVGDRYTQAFLGRDDVHFFLFEPPHQVFREVGREEWRQQRARILAPKGEAPQPHAPRSLRLTARHYAVTLAKKVTPAPLKRAARAQLNAYRQSNRGAHAERNHPFAAGDTVLVIGGNWGDDFIGFMEGLAKIRRKLDIRLLHVVHDVIPLRYPNYFSGGNSFERYFTAAAQAADGYLCNSETTRRDLATFLESKQLARQPELLTFRLGEDFSLNGKPVRPKLPLDKEFILCVGTIEARKNQALIYNMRKLALQKGIDVPQIVIAGRVGWMATETLRNLTVDPDLAGKVLVSHTISDEEKAWLFEHCLFSVYPSFYEGWGLPVVESLCSGKVSLCSNSSSLQEAGGTYAVYYSPYDAGEFLARVQEYRDPAVRGKQEAHIATRPRFTWTESYEQFARAVDALRYGR